MARKNLDGQKSSLHAAFKIDNEDIDMSLSSFQKHRPKHIDVADKTKLRQCACEYCVNIEYKINALNKFPRSKAANCNIKDKYHLSDITLCPQPSRKYPRPECIQRTCEYCGVTQLEDYLCPIEPYGDDVVQYLKWENVQMDKIQNNKPMRVTRKVLEVKKETVNVTISELTEESKTFSNHLFKARWQNDTLKQLRENIPVNSVVHVLDFAENFTCDFQDKISAAHWIHALVTVHPTVCYYPELWPILIQCIIRSLYRL